MVFEVCSPTHAQMVEPYIWVAVWVRCCPQVKEAMRRKCSLDVVRFLFISLSDSHAQST
jgi:hypothetical protein